MGEVPGEHAWKTEVVFELDGPKIRSVGELHWIQNLIPARTILLIFDAHTNLRFYMEIVSRVISFLSQKKRALFLLLISLMAFSIPHIKSWT